jgi:DNA-binding NtrC family response regulator
MSSTVVLREDDPDLCELVHELLEEQNFVVHDVVEIGDLMETCTRRSPCVALIDSTSSTEFDLWHLGPMLANLGVPAVAFTAHATARRQFEANSNGYVGVVSKPFDADEFIRLVESICWEEHHAVAS